MRLTKKATILGLGYGMGATKFRATCAQADIQVTQQFAQNTVDKFRSTYSYIPEFCCALLFVPMKGHFGPGPSGAMLSIAHIYIYI